MRKSLSNRCETVRCQSESVVRDRKATECLKRIVFGDDDARFLSNSPGSACAVETVHDGFDRAVFYLGRGTTRTDDAVDSHFRP